MGSYSTEMRGQQYPFQEIGLEQGLPATRINDFMQDSRGFYWLATDATGLIRYDGYEFKTFNFHPLLGRGFVSSLSEDEDGRLWLAVENALLLFDGSRFTDYPLPENTGRIKKIQAVAGEGVFVLSSRGDIFRFRQGELQSIYRDKERPAREISTHKKALIFSTDSALWQVNAGKMALLLEAPVNAFASDGEGLQISLAGSRPSKETEFTVDWPRVRYLHASTYRTIGLGMNSSLIVRQRNGKYLSLSARNGLPERNYKACYTDRAGVIWLYSNDGLVKLESLAWRLYSDFPAATPPVTAVLPQGEKIYAGMRNGLAVIDAEGNIAMKEDYRFGLCLALANHRDKLWAGTEKGLLAYDASGSFRVYEDAGFVFSLKSHQGSLYCGSDRGLLRWNGSSLKAVTLPDGSPIPTVYAFSEAPDGSLWAATYLQGFFRLHNARWEKLSVINGLKVDSLRFSCFVAISKEELWAGSSNEGLFHFGPGGINHLSPAQLNFAEIYSLQKGSEDRIWAGTNKGILEIRQKGREIISLSTSSGFMGGYCSPNALETSGDYLVAGTVNGLQLLNLNSYQFRRPAPRLSLTGIKLFLEESDLLHQNASDTTDFTMLPKDMELPHNLNFISFNMAGLTAYHQEKLRYRYRLLGQNEEWTFAGARREAIFSNIKPGKYTFEAEVSRQGEEWSPHRISYTFRILRPFWLRWWFITLLVLLVAAVTYFYIRDRIKRINQRLRLENALLDMERKALRLQMNPHFIFNALDSISSFIFKKDPEKAVRYLNNFAKLMRLTLESSMEHLHPVETEVSILKNYLELEKLRFQGKFEYEIEVDEDIDYDVGIPPMLIQPHVENAILHGLKPRGQDGQLKIKFMLQDDLLLVEVDDNGIGRKAAREMGKKRDHRSMATQINRDRLRLLKKSMSDKVDIRIIDKEEDGTASGTRVVIRLPAEEI